VAPLRRSLRGSGTKTSACPPELELCQPKKKHKPPEPVCPLSLPLCRERQQRQQQQAAVAAAAAVEGRREKRATKQAALAYTAALVPSEALAPVTGIIAAVSGPSAAAAAKRAELKVAAVRARAEAASLAPSDAQQAVLRAFLRGKRRDEERRVRGGRHGAQPSLLRGADEGAAAALSLSYGDRKARAIVRHLALQQPRTPPLEPRVPSGSERRRRLGVGRVHAAAVAAECPLALKVCRQAKAKLASVVRAKAAEAKDAALAERLRKETTGELKQDAADEAARAAQRTEAKAAVKVIEGERAMQPSGLPTFLGVALYKLPCRLSKATPSVYASHQASRACV
jgi:hypothetical protein